MKTTCVILITGFLGSGKTTFLANAISANQGKRKIAVVQNEFAPANLDGKELMRTVNENFDLLEINNGSLFCVCLLADFVSSLEKFVREYHPDVLYIEASGLSDPVAIGEVLGSENLKDKLFFSGTICIVDALNFEKISKFQKRVEHQVRIADKIIVNKKDLFQTSGDLKETLKKYNPFAPIYETSYCKVPVEEILSPITQTESIRIAGLAKSAKSDGRPDIQSAVLRTTRAFDRNHLKSFLDEVSERAIRMKGYIFTKDSKMIAVQSTFGENESKEIQFDQKQTELIAMGYDINARLLSELYKKYI